ncbi:uncharacterized protein LOC125039400 [Penaeus chinensis]|uniref:uncharacterized protein LOC125039400 n=1 Tax=Penaeus chinensis TaxID=139456 RepID=UPI001FB609F9|nr:uncharacterized protein LOC125039400 [Penaeus chinensis]XP_047489234.1 uncharacterized protein LOC125039400 [Penaeus chinensis]
MMEEVQELDVELLISLVKDRPVLWDKSLDEYKSRAETTAAWREVCNILNEDFEYLSDEAKIKYGKLISTKWTNVRDCYKKYLKKLQEKKKTGSKANSFKKYVYSDQMSFLQKNNMRKEMVPSVEVNREELDDNEHGINNPEGSLFVKKWTNNINDSWPSTQRKMLDQKISDADGKTGKYACEQQLAFTKKNRLPKESLSNFMLENAEHNENEIISQNGSGPSEEISPAQPTRMNKKRKLDGIEQKILNTLEAPEDRHLCFFKGIIPSLEKFSEEQIIEFQIGVLKVLQNVRQGLLSWEPPDIYT